MMKILSINGYFLLPDNFKGTFGDAMKCMANYNKNQEKEKKMSIGKRLPMKKKQAYTYQEIIWNNFQKALKKGKKLHAISDITEWKENKNEWVSIIK